MQLRPIGGHHFLLTCLEKEQTDTRGFIVVTQLSGIKHSVNRIRNKVLSVLQRKRRVCVHNIQVIPIVGQNDFP